MSDDETLDNSPNKAWNPGPDESHLRYTALDLATRINTFESTPEDIVKRAEAFLNYLRGNDSTGKSI